MALGRAGEDLAADWYIARGYQIVERNWRSKVGELDLVCARGDVVVFSRSRPGAPTVWWAG